MNERYDRGPLVRNVKSKLAATKGFLKGAFLAVRLIGGLGVMKATGSTVVAKSALKDINSAYGDMLRDLCREPEFKTMAMDMLRDKVIDSRRRILEMPKVAKVIEEQEKVRQVLGGVVELGMRINNIRASKRRA